MRPSPRTAVLATVLALAAAGCSSGSAATKKVADTSALPFKDCGQVACTGKIDGAAYRIELPKRWNGTLLLWSHGYREASARPGSTTLQTFAEDAPDRKQGGGFRFTGEEPREETAVKALLDQGYALAGSAYASNGWAVLDGIKAGEQLHDFFVQNVSAPRRTYVWGESLGGLITELLSEKHPEWVAGAAPQCGAVAGATENLDGGLAVAYMVKTLIDPGLKISGYASHDEAVAAFERATKAVTAAAQDVAGGGTAKVASIAAIGHLAVRTSRFDGHDVVSQVSAKAEEIITALGFATFGQQEFATRVGGQGLDINGVSLGASVTDADRATVKAFGGDLDKYLAQLASGTRPPVDATAREQALAQGEPTGKIAHPTVTLHTEDDPLVIVQNERVLADRVFKAGGTPRLLQLYTKAPATYSAPAPYGAGHCTFTPTEEVGLVTVLDGWVRTGHRPTLDQAKAAFAPPTGLDTSYAPLPFPLTRS